MSYLNLSAIIYQISKNVIGSNLIPSYIYIYIYVKINQASNVNVR